MAYRVALIGCSAKKLTFACWARNLYLGSRFVSACEYTWFKEPMDRSLVLSSLHGAVSMGAWLDPYDDSLASKSADQVRTWARKVRRQLKVLLPREHTITVLADDTYTDPLREVLPNAQFPFAGMDEEKQKAFFVERLYAA